MRMMVEADVSPLRGVRDSLTMTTSDLEQQIEGLKEELTVLKFDHKQVSAFGCVACRAASSAGFEAVRHHTCTCPVSLFLQEIQAQKVQQTGAVNVEVDSAESVDLTLVLQEVREQYESLVLKNKIELEKWFQSKVRGI